MREASKRVPDRGMGPDGLQLVLGFNTSAGEQVAMSRIKLLRNSTPSSAFIDPSMSKSPSSG